MEGMGRPVSFIKQRLAMPLCRSVAARRCCANPARAAARSITAPQRHGSRRGHGAMRHASGQEGFGRFLRADLAAHDLLLERLHKLQRARVLSEPQASPRLALHHDVCLGRARVAPDQRHAQCIVPQGLCRTLVARRRGLLAQRLHDATAARRRLLVRLRDG
eukprot:5973046-Lingulodinium_polyedra.AAC.2